MTCIAAQRILARAGSLPSSPAPPTRRLKLAARDRLAHRLRLYLALHEGANALDGRSRFWKNPRPDLPSVRHPRPYFEFDLTSGGAHPLRHAHGIIEEDFVAADLDERRAVRSGRRKAATHTVCEDRRRRDNSSRAALPPCLAASDRPRRFAARNCR